MENIIYGVDSVVVYTYKQLQDLVIFRDAEIRSLKLRVGILENRIQYLLEQRASHRKTKVPVFKFEDIPSIRSRKRRK